MSDVRACLDFLRSQGISALVEFTRRQIQELLGHKHLDSKQRYARVNAHQLRGAVKRLRGCPRHAAQTR